MTERKQRPTTLINFIASLDLIESFDLVCSYKSQTRTSTLRQLMMEYVEEQLPLLQDQITRQKQIKKDLLNSDIQRDRENYSHNKLMTFKEWMNWNSKQSEPPSFFMQDFDE